MPRNTVLVMSSSYTEAFSRSIILSYNGILLMDGTWGSVPVSNEYKNAVTTVTKRLSESNSTAS